MDQHKSHTNQETSNESYTDKHNTNYTQDTDILTSNEHAEMNASISTSNEDAVVVPSVDPSIESAVDPSPVQYAINASHQGLTEIPQDLIARTDIAQLDLRRNKLTSLPNELAFSKMLLKLDLYDNNLENVPMVLTDMTNLESLDLSYNCLVRIDALPGGRSMTKQGNETFSAQENTSVYRNSLVKLYAASNDICCLDDLGDFDLRKLCILDLGNNCLSDNAGKRKHSCCDDDEGQEQECNEHTKGKNKRPYAQRTSNSHDEQNIEKDCPSVAQTKTLNAIDLKDKVLESKPKSHHTLWPINNELMPSLQQLFLTCNSLQSLPDCHGMPQKLSILAVQYNQLTQLDVSGLPCLVELHASNNRIESLLDVLIPSSLRVLDLCHNELKTMKGKTVKASAVHNKKSDSCDVTESKSQSSAFESAAFCYTLSDDISRESAACSLIALPSNWSNVRELYLANNKLDYPIDSFLSELSKWMPQLECIFLLGNPMAERVGANYVNKVRAYFPNILQVDHHHFAPLSSESSSDATH